MSSPAATLLPLSSFTRAAATDEDELEALWTHCLNQLAAAVDSLVSKRKSVVDAGAEACDSRPRSEEVGNPTAILHCVDQAIQIGPIEMMYPPYMRSYLLHAAVSVACLQLADVLGAIVHFAAQEQCQHCFSAAQVRILKGFPALPPALKLAVSAQAWSAWVSGVRQSDAQLLRILQQAVASFEQLTGQQRACALEYVCLPAAGASGDFSLQCTAPALRALREASVVWAASAVGSSDWLGACSWQLLKAISGDCSPCPAMPAPIKQHTVLASPAHIRALKLAREFHAACATRSAESIKARKAALKDDETEFPDVVEMLCAPLKTLFRWTGTGWSAQAGGLKVLSNWACQGASACGTYSKERTECAHPFLSQADWALALLASGAAPASRVWMGVSIVARALLRLGQHKMGTTLLAKMACWPHKAHWLGAHEVYSSVLLLWVGAVKRSSNKQHSMQWQHVAAAATATKQTPAAMHAEAQELLEQLSGIAGTPASDQQAHGTLQAAGDTGSTATFAPLWPALEPQHSQLLQLLHADPFASKPKQLKRSRSVFASPPPARHGRRGWAARRFGSHSQEAPEAPSPASSKTSFDAAAVPSVKLLVSRWQPAAQTSADVPNERAALMAVLPTAHTGSLALFARKHRLECSLRPYDAASQASARKEVTAENSSKHERRQTYAGLHKEFGCSVEECALQMLCNVVSPNLFCKDIARAASRATSARTLQATSYTPEVVQATTAWEKQGSYPREPQQKGIPSPLGLLGWRGMHAENGLWRMLKAVCFAELLLETGQPVIRTRPFCALWGTRAFAAQRKSTMDELLQKIRGMLPCQAAEWVFNQHRQFCGAVLPGVQWDLFSAELLAEVVHCMCSGPMGSISLADWLQYALEEAPGIEVGYPDLVLWMPTPCPAKCKWAQVFSLHQEATGGGSLDMGVSESTQLGCVVASQDAVHCCKSQHDSTASEAAAAFTSPKRQQDTQQASGQSMSTPGSSLWNASSNASAQRPVIWSGTRFALLEVKSASDSIRDAQRMWMYWFSQHPGFTAGIVHVGIAKGTDDRRVGKRSRLFMPASSYPEAQAAEQR